MEVFKKIAASLLLSVYLFSASAISELLKLPLLVAHYYDHKTENKDIGVMSFLTLHYYAENGTDKDAKEDSQLPFKSVENGSTASFVSLTPPSFIELLSKQENKINLSFLLYTDLYVPSQYLVAIWQPPRYC